MPRPKKEGAPEPKRRSRNGCWPCKSRKVKCGEEKPRCLNCERQGETCDYSIRLNWGGRSKRKGEGHGFVDFSATSTTSSPGSPYFPAPEAFTGPSSPASAPATRQYFRSVSPRSSPSHHVRARSDVSLIDPDLRDIKPTLPTLQGDILGNGWLFQDKKAAETVKPRGVTSSPLDLRQQTLQQYNESDYPAPSLANIASPGLVAAPGYQLCVASPTASATAMLPPIRNLSGVVSPNAASIVSSDSYHYLEPPNKRTRVAAAGCETLPRPGQTPWEQYTDTSNGSVSLSDVQSPNAPHHTPYSPFAGTPLTPGSSVTSDENLRFAPRPGPPHYEAPTDLRRLSVQSLLSGPPGDGITNTSSSRPQRQYPISSRQDQTTTYGFDLGLADLDTPKNDDLNAIKVFSPTASHKTVFGEASQDDGEAVMHSLEPSSRDIAFEPGGYYSRPVPIKIPQTLEPLSSRLLENPMNLLYFHHFLNHTARILIPHDCEQNPFRTILPQMAVHDDNLLSLLLAYSASHRARLLNHSEPANRIAVWVQNVFPKLRQTLYEPSEQVSVANITSAIMMASLEIISPNTFEVPISWQSLLRVARQMIIARGGPQSIHRRDKVAYFLIRWFAYLDVLGSLSGRKNDLPLSSCYWSDDVESDKDGFEIDCLFGFTSRCIGILARIAELAKQCESERIDVSGNINPEWEPSEDTINAAEKLKLELLQGREGEQPYKACTHRSYAESENEAGWDSLEIYATNEAFHWAGLIHLSRRVLGKPSDDGEVQGAVREIVGLLYKVRHGSTAESCLLFPMFTAGCDAIDSGQRQKIMDRLKSVEDFGLTQVHKARTLMQKVWDTGKPWESLVEDEFFG